MSTTLAIAIYVVVWWVVLFAILPIGLRTQGEDGDVVPGTPASAPARPRLLRIVVTTTVVSALLCAVLWAVFNFEIISLERLIGRGAGK